MHPCARIYVGVGFPKRGLWSRLPVNDQDTIDKPWPNSHEITWLWNGSSGIRIHFNMSYDGYNEHCKLVGVLKLDGRSRCISPAWIALRPTVSSTSGRVQGFRTLHDISWTPECLEHSASVSCTTLHHQSLERGFWSFIDWLAPFSILRFWPSMACRLK